MTITATTSSVDDTRALGRALAEVLVPGTVLVLAGGLGAGKTALSQGIAAGLGVEARVTSPTFTMVATHETDGRRGIAHLLHADLYRVGSGTEADDLAIAEMVEDAAVALVEWGDMAPGVLGPAQATCTISLGDADDDRILVLDLGGSAIDPVAAQGALGPWMVT
jgi:tRNA threonylcarbamoyladenosine biosynthesis protein TsaE